MLDKIRIIYYYLTMNQEMFIGGCEPSKEDYRTLVHSPVMATGEPVPLIVEATDYNIEDIMMQYKNGICTAINFVQMVNKATGEKYNQHIQYMFQKIDFDCLGQWGWNEGSSLFSAMKIGNKTGLVRNSDIPSDIQVILDKITPETRYPEYVQILKEIANNPEMVQRLRNIAYYKIKGYAQVDLSKGREYYRKCVADSKVGLYCRYVVTEDWWKDAYGNVTWDGNRICPLDNRFPEVSGHAITNYKCDDTQFRKNWLANTWSTAWGFGGKGFTNEAKVAVTEAYILYFDDAPNLPKLPKKEEFNYVFARDIRFGQSDKETGNQDVFNLQTALKIMGYLKVNPTGYYGDLTATAVRKFVWDKKLLPITGKITGPLVRSLLNERFSKANELDSVDEIETTKDKAIRYIISSARVFLSGFFAAVLPLVSGGVKYEKAFLVGLLTAGISAGLKTVFEKMFKPELSTGHLRK